MNRLPLTITSIIAGLFAGTAFAGEVPAQSKQDAVSKPAHMQAAPNPTVHLKAPEDSLHHALSEPNSNTKIGLGKGDFLIRLSAIGVITNNTSSSVNVYPYGARGTGINGGTLSVTNQAAPELTFEYFLNDHFSVDAIAASTRHVAKAHNVAALRTLHAQDTNPDVGSFWVLPPTVTLAYHFLPHKRFNPYTGIGLTMAFFHNTSSGSSYFNDPHLKVTPGPSFNFGFDYQLAGNWFMNVDAKQILLSVPVSFNAPGTGLSKARIHARDSVNPTIVGAGIGYRF